MKDIRETNDASQKLADCGKISFLHFPRTFTLAVKNYELELVLEYVNVISVRSSFFSGVLVPWLTTPLLRSKNHM